MRPRLNFFAKFVKGIFVPKSTQQKINRTADPQWSVETQRWALRLLFFSWTEDLVKMEGIMRSSKYQSI